jgi:hypothetical protein
MRRLILAALLSAFAGSGQAESRPLRVMLFGIQPYASVSTAVRMLS